MRRLIVGMTGSTGAIFGVRFLEALKHADVESHLIISKWAQRTIEHETNYTIEQVRSLASVVHSQGDMTPPPATARHFPLSGVQRSQVCGQSSRDKNRAPQQKRRANKLDAAR